MKEDPIGNAARKARREHRVPPGTVCALCGEQDCECLIAVDRTILDEHHIFGEGNLSEPTVWLCPTCHRKLHIAMEDAGIDLTHPKEHFVVKVVALVLLVCAVLFRALADTFEWCGHKLSDFADGLDRDHPTWRTMPEAAL